jgi:hypothetical protein
MTKLTCHVLRCATTIAALLCVTTQAGADTITSVTVQGTITSVDNLQGLLPQEFQSIAVGDSFSVNYLFQNVVPDSNPLPAAGSYLGETIYSMSVTVGSQTFSIPVGTGGGTDDMGLFVLDDFTQSGTLVDQLAYQRVGCNVFDVTFMDCYSGLLLLRETGLSPTALSSTDPVPAPLNFLDFSSRRFEFRAAALYGSLDSGASARDGFVGTIDNVSIEAAPVPEPGTFLIVALGLAGLGARSYRRRSHTAVDRTHGCPSTSEFFSDARGCPRAAEANPLP